MSDLFQPLREVEAVSPISAQDVRRRGDRMRRSRRLLQASGAAAAVMAVAVGVTVLLGDRPAANPPVAPSPTVSESPSPAPSPSRGWVTSTPKDLPLAHGYPPDGGDGELRGPSRQVDPFADVTVCGRPLRLPSLPTDELAVVYEGPEDSRARQLVLHDTGEAVVDDLEAFAGLYRDCPTDGDARNELTRVGLGDDAWRVVTTYYIEGDMPALGQRTMHAVRVGNALLLSRVYGESAGATDPHASERDADAATDRERPVVASLCVFAVEPCSTGG